MGAEVLCAGWQMLRLSPAQEEQLLQLRTKHLRNLRSLYEDRQRLNLGVRVPTLLDSAFQDVTLMRRIAPQILFCM